MKFDVYYLIGPRPALRNLAEQSGSTLGELLTETSLLTEQQGHPSYPLDGMDRKLYVKAVFMRALRAEYAGDLEFERFWGSGAPSRAADFDTYWTLQVLGCEHLAALEAQAREAPGEGERPSNTGNAAVDAALDRLSDRDTSGS